MCLLISPKDCSIIDLNKLKKCRVLFILETWTVKEIRTVFKIVFSKRLVHLNAVGMILILLEDSLNRTLTYATGYTELSPDCVWISSCMEWNLEFLVFVSCRFYPLYFFILDFSCIYKSVQKAPKTRLTWMFSFWIFDSIISTGW